MPGAGERDNWGVSVNGNGRQALALATHRTEIGDHLNPGFKISLGNIQLQKQQLQKRYRISIWEHEKVWETDGSDGCKQCEWT